VDDAKTLWSAGFFKDLIPTRAKIRSKYPVMAQPIQQQIIQLLLRKGCSYGRSGEFTRAFLTETWFVTGEAVADLISSDNEAAQIAMQQMRGILNDRQIAWGV
jgi:hypothetical protein